MGLGLELGLGLGSGSGLGLGLGFGQEVDLVGDDDERVGGADDGREVGREGAVEVEEVDHGDDQAAAAREALEQRAEVLGLQVLMLRRGAHPQGVGRQPVLVAQTVAPDSG